MVKWGSFGTRRSHYGSLMGEYNSVGVSGGYIWLNGTQLRSVGVLSRSLWGSVRVSGAQRGSVGPVGLSAQCKYTSLYRLIHLFD